RPGRNRVRLTLQKSGLRIERELWSASADADRKCHRARALCAGIEQNPRGARGRSAGRLSDRNGVRHGGERREWRWREATTRTQEYSRGIPADAPYREPGGRQACDSIAVPVNAAADAQNAAGSDHPRLRSAQRRNDAADDAISES